MNFFAKPFAAKQTLGSRGEDYGADFLKQKGYEILEKNYRCKIGELDLIAFKKDRIIFFEVRTRKEGGHFGSAEESIRADKQRKLTQLANWYLKSKNLTDIRASFGVLAVTAKTDGSYDSRLFDNAFDAHE